MTYLLAGDIGGTKTILRLVNATASNPAKLQITTCYEALYSSQAYPDLVPMVKEFLHTAAEQMGQMLQPVRACFAIAGPVVDNCSSLTNLAWSLEGDRLQEELSLDRVELINDFEAVGYGVFGLEPGDLHTLQEETITPMPPWRLLARAPGWARALPWCKTGGGWCFLQKGATQTLRPGRS